MRRQAAIARWAFHWAMALVAVAGAGDALAAPPGAVPPYPPLPSGLPGPTAMTDQPCGSQAGAVADWAALCRYRQANRQIGFTPRAVFIGDSITEWWLPASPGLFAAGVVDRGIAGQTSAQVMARFYQDVVLLHPRVVHIMCGTNDLAGNTGATSPDAYANAIVAMVDLARANGIAVVIGAIPPAAGFNWRPGLMPARTIAALNVWLADLARQRGAIFADYHAALAGPDGAMKPGLSIDGVHPTAAGYAVMEPIARAAIDEAERQARAAPITTAGEDRRQ